MISGLIKKLISKNSIIDVDFSKSWLNLAWSQRGIIFPVMVYIGIDEASLSLFPIAVGAVIASKSYVALFAMAAFYLFWEIFGWFTYYPWMTRLTLQTYDSFRYSAYKHFLLADPSNFNKNPSGVVIGKIQRASLAYYDFIDEVVDEVFSTIVEFVVVFITMLYFNVNLGLLTGFSIIFTSLAFSYLSSIFTSDLESQANQADDVANKVGAESVHQFFYIRNTFSTENFISRLFKNSMDSLFGFSRVELTHRFIRGIFLCIYHIFLSLIIFYIIRLVRAEEITIMWGTTLVLTYLRGTKGLFKIDKRVMTILKSYRRIIDFYYFIDSMTDQKFPVLTNAKNDPVVVRDGRVNLNFDKVSFGYSEDSLIFDNNYFDLNVDVLGNKTNLYGIIGPSGIGKTTLISILGGQCKPDSGAVLVNGIDIYQVGDSTKKQLLAIQGQSAVGLYGSLKYNLLFGVSKDFEFSDEDLVKLLKDVGIWSIFETKLGLETEVGESGTSLSGGQKQRLNFANLYLRAKCYKPLVILIDEPTSSLDAISEKAITDMILELSKTSLTFVIAHRIQTLQDANKILDFSLIKKNSELEFYSQEHLNSISNYYKKLISGSEELH